MDKKLLLEKANKMLSKAGIPIDEKNQALIEAVIERKQEGCRVRTIDATDVFRWTKYFKGHYGWLPTATIDGTRFEVDEHGQHFANSYKGVPMSTQFTVEVKRGVYRLTGVKRDACSTWGGSIKVSMSKKMERAILESYRRPRGMYGVLYNSRP